MNRRHFVLGALAAVAGGAWLARPRGEGAPHEPYFAALDVLLKREGPMRPSLVIDLDRLDHNLALVTASAARGGKALRLVEKSLPSPGLLEYLMKASGTNRLMSFHQPFLNQDAQRFPRADILLGKPLPAASAARFYREHRGAFDPSRQLQWLIDTPQRLGQYLELARGLGTRLRINVELDVGLHRGGVADDAQLDAVLAAIAQNPQQLEFAGFMGYDPFVGMGVPRVLGTPEELLARVLASYQARLDFLRARHPALARGALTLNTAGSPTYRLHEQERVANEIAVGTGLLKPSHYDLATLTDHVPAAFIATPVLKATGPVRLPVLEGASAVLSWWDPNRRQTYFVYGGNWMADYESPRGLRGNTLYGRSSNQEIVNGSVATALAPDDHVFLRPWQSESVLLQFGELLAVRGGAIVERWPVFAG